jgi:hypothetical protein
MSKIVISILAYNCEPFIASCLASIYDFADKIVVVEGSLERARIYGSRSSDNTINIVKRFPDPKNKISLFFMNKHEHDHRNIALKFCNEGDWYFTVDQDEIYKEHDLANLRKIIEKDKNTFMFRFWWYNFYFNFRIYMKEVSPPRLFKVLKGCRFVRRNSMVTKDGLPYEKLKNKILPADKIIMYHYGYIWNVRQKGAFYGKDGLEWYETVLKKFTWKNRQAIYKINAKRTKGKPGIHLHGGGMLKSFKGKHPDAMKGNMLRKRDLIKEYKKGTIEPLYEPRTMLEHIRHAFRYFYYGVLLK